MSTKYPYLRLKIPSLSQGNPHDSKSDVWCGRTVASMIQNYYIATRKPGGLAEAYGELVVNQRNKAEYDLVYRGGPRAGEIAVHEYDLVPAVQRQKERDWQQHFLLPVGDPARAAILAGEPMTEAEVLQRMAPIITALEHFNPVMIYTGLSSSNGLPDASGKRRAVRHLVCVSGYRRDADGALWLHIDDPSTHALDGDKLRELTLEQEMEATKLLGITDAITQLYPDSAADELPGRRYWLRAAVLFQPNLNSRHSSTDFWCDHEDTPGFRVYVNHVAEPRGSMVEVSGDPRYPVSLPTEDPDKELAISALWDAVARSGAPYPLSNRRSWHNGIHIPFTEGVTLDDDVHAIAPGRVVLAWFPERKPGEPDRGMVIIRHAIDPQALAFVDAREAEPPTGAVWVHSLYANLAGGEAGAAALLAKLAPKGGKPEPRRFARIGAPIGLLTESGVHLVPIAHEGLAAEHDEAELVAVDGTSYFAIHQTNTLVASWTDAAAALDPTSPHHALRMRLDAGESRLVGVQLDGKPWVQDGEIIKVKDGSTDTDARLFRVIKGAGTTRYFPEKTPGKDYLDVTIDAVSTLSPVEVFHSNSRDRALVEIREVVDGLSDNAAEIAAWEAANAGYARVLALVCGAKYADLDGDDPAYRDFVDEPIGKMGVQRDDATGTALGVHVEVFCKQDLTANASAGGRWSPLVEVPGFGNGTADFFAAQLDALLSATPSRNSTGGAHTSDPSLQGAAGDAQPTSLLSLHADGTPITVTEWLSHCSDPDHARELSQIVAKHRSEWTLDLVEDASNRVSLQGIPAELRKAVLPASLGQPGLDTDTFYYFHPLRLIEWLRTGVDVTLHDLPSSVRDAVSLVLRLGDTEFDLVRQGTEDNYRLRLVLGDGGSAGDDDDDDDEPAGTARAVLILHGIDTANPELEVELKRNTVAGLRFTQPGGSGVAIRMIGGGNFGVTFSSRGILCATGEEKVIYLLGDVGGPLDHLECSRAIVSAEVRYNLAPPERLGLTMPGDGFVVETLEVSGAEVDEPAGGWATAASYDLAIHEHEPDEADADTDHLVTAAATVLVKVVIAPTCNTRSSGPVEIELSGGDLTAPVKGDWSIAQRDIEYGARGGDVAKLQVYLTQILCGAFGCLRGTKGPVASVDGDYGMATSLALWRFLLVHRAWFGPDYKVPTSGADVELDGWERTDAEIELEAKALHDAHKGPKVNQALVDLIVSYYCLPYIGFQVAVTVDEPVLRFAVPEVTAKWKGWNNQARTRVPPLPDAVELHVSVALKSDATGDLATVPLCVELNDGAAYRLLTTNVKTLADLVAQGITLVPSGSLAPGTKPRLVVRLESGAELTAIDLGGATDVRTGATAAGLDAAMIQKWLTAFPDKKGKPYLGSVDGSFGSGSKKALEAFCKDVFANHDDPTYVEILEELRLAEGQQCALAEGA